MDRGFWDLPKEWCIPSLFIPIIVGELGAILIYGVLILLGILSGGLAADGKP